MFSLYEKNKHFNYNLNYSIFTPENNSLFLSIHKQLF